MSLTCAIFDRLLISTRFASPSKSPAKTLVSKDGTVGEANTQNIEISALCRAMSSCGMQAARIGALSDHDAGRQYSVFSQPDQKIAAGEITLQEVLQEEHKSRLRRSDRFQIALAVSSSHLQLQSTGWGARKQWQAADIRFPRTINSREDPDNHVR